MQLKNSIILITGSAGRIGKTTAMLLARNGAQIVLHYHSQKAKARETAGEIAAIGKQPLIVNGDLSLAETWMNIKEKILLEFGKINVLVNNSAIFYRTPFLNSTETQWDHFMSVNLKSVYLGSKILGEVMYQQKRGKIINLADVAGETIWENYIPYSVSKAGVIALTKGLAKALAPHVTVNAVSPGAVLLPDDYSEKQESYLIETTPLKRIGSPEDIAQTILFLIEGSDFITGNIVKVDGGRSLK